MSAPPPPERPLVGILLRIGSATLYAVMAALLKLASEDGVVAGEMLFYRALFGLPVVLAWVLPTAGWRGLATARPGAHFLRSALGTVSILMTFQAFILLPLATAITIGFTAPVFATLLSALLLGEPVGARRWAAVGLGFTGIVVATRPEGGALPPLGIAVAILSALGQGSVTVTLRRLGRTEGPAAIVFWFFVFSVVVGALLLPFVGSWHRPGTYALLLAGGLAGGAMQLMMTAALRHAPVSVLAPFDYTQIVWALALGWLVFGQGPTWTVLAGAALVAASGLYTAWREHRRRMIPAPALPLE